MKTKYPFYDIVHEIKTIKDLIALVPKSYQDNPVFCYKDGKEIKEKFKEEFVSDINKIGRMLHKRFDKGSHIALLGKTSYEWISCYFAIMNSENIAVPLDKELAAEDLLEFIEFADTDCIIYDSDYIDIIKFIKEHSKQEFIYICMQNYGDDEALPNAISSISTDTFWEGNPQSDDIAEIVFTSGTTGKSKGCMITHGNLAWNAMNGSSFVDITTEDKVLSILPINHTLEIAAGIMTPLYKGSTLYLNDSLKYLARNLSVFKPTGMVVVPLVIETLYKNIWREINKQGKTKKVKFAMKFVSLLYKCHIDIRRKIFAEILNQLGGGLRLMVVGGAYIEPKLIKDFDAWGITIVQGYGITECAPVITCNTDRYRKIDSVGRVVTGSKLKLVDNEILVSGPIVMKGYYKNPQATSEVFDDNWFKTGDLGYLDKDNYLHITGRKKNLIILSNGKNVSPEELEQKILRFSYVKEVLVSEKNGIIEAEIFPDKEAEPNANTKIHEDILLLNKNLPNYKKIVKVVLREQEFDKTTTRKIKRNN